MERVHEIRFSLALLFSILLHLFVSGFLIMPYVLDPQRSKHLAELLSKESYQIRDVIVNINEDDQSVESPYTLFSERSSSARGHMSEQKGDTWLNNSQTFTAPRTSSSQNKERSGALPRLLYTKENATFKVSLVEPQDVTNPIIELAKEAEQIKQRSENKEQLVTATQDVPAFEQSEWTKIPDRKGMTLENAIYLTSDREFSFNTKKFEDFEYFRNMKQKIGNHWYPPTLANMRHYYAGGYTQSRLIASQEVYLYFIMNRAGDVLSVTLVDSRGNQYLNQSCIDAVANSKNFGPVPDSIEGEKIVIPFIFGFYVR